MSTNTKPEIENNTNQTEDSSNELTNTEVEELTEEEKTLHMHLSTKVGTSASLAIEHEHTSLLNRRGDREEEPVNEESFKELLDKVTAVTNLSGGVLKLKEHITNSIDVPIMVRGFIPNIGEEVELIDDDAFTELSVVLIPKLQESLASVEEGFVLGEDKQVLEATVNLLSYVLENKEEKQNIIKTSGGAMANVLFNISQHIGDEPMAENIIKLSNYLNVAGDYSQYDFVITLQGFGDTSLFMISKDVLTELEKDNISIKNTDIAVYNNLKQSNGLTLEEFKVLVKSGMSTHAYVILKTNTFNIISEDENVLNMVKDLIEENDLSGIIDARHIDFRDGPETLIYKLVDLFDDKRVGDLAWLMGRLLNSNDDDISNASFQMIRAIMTHKVTG